MSQRTWTEDEHADSQGDPSLCDAFTQAVAPTKVLWARWPLLIVDGRLTALFLVQGCLGRDARIRSFAGENLPAKEFSRSAFAGDYKVDEKRWLIARGRTMPVVRGEPILRFIRKLAVRGQTAARLPDRELLECFVKKRDEEAFAALLRRHGPMVLRVCLQILNNEHDAEDAFQATFLVLSRKATSVRKQESVGSWLFGVATHTATKLKRNLARRRCYESKAGQPRVADPLSALTLREAQTILNDELARLPEKYRAPVVLCSLKGLTRDEAAEQLGWPAGKLKNRLEQARKQLRVRLVSRGLTLSGALLASVFCEQMARATLPAGLLSSTVQAATSVAAGNAAASVVSAKVAALTEGVLKAMFMTKLKIATAIVMAASLIVGGSGVLTFGRLTAQQSEPRKADPPETRAFQATFAGQLNEDSPWQFRQKGVRKYEDAYLKNTLWALEERRTEACAKGDWETQQKFLADDFIGVSARAARSTKDAIIEGAKHIRCVDWKTRDVEVRRVSNDVAILTYIYDCKELSTDGKLVRTLRDHRASLVWVQRNGGWVIVFCQETVLPGGE